VCRLNNFLCDITEDSPSFHLWNLTSFNTIWEQGIWNIYTVNDQLAISGHKLTNHISYKHDMLKEERQVNEFCRRIERRQRRKVQNSFTELLLLEPCWCLCLSGLRIWALTMTEKWEIWTCHVKGSSFFFFSMHQRVSE
jgi:hypothetical protein